MNVVHCQKCNAEIVFVLTDKAKRMPVDLSSTKPGDRFYEHGRHVSHFATCPNAKDFRRAK